MTKVLLSFYSFSNFKKLTYLQSNNFSYIFIKPLGYPDTQKSAIFN